jgi:hypothetical protein
MALACFFSRMPLAAGILRRLAFGFSRGLQETNLACEGNYFYPQICGCFLRKRLFNTPRLNAPA